MTSYLKKNIFFLVLIIGMIVFYWVRYRVAPNIEFAETKVSDRMGKELFLGEELNNKPTVLHFYAHWCGPCLKEIRTLNSRIAQLENNGIQVVFITDESPAQIAELASTLPSTVRFYKVGKLTNLGIHTIPTTFFIDSSGETKKKIVDVCNWENDDFCNEIISNIK
ncbi:MAG: TlpA family protein disulfide reductase [Flavobacteriales bacterium]